MDKEIKGEFEYDQDSKRYHRFKIETEVGIVGQVYIPKRSQPLPDKIVLERKDVNATAS